MNWQPEPNSLNQLVDLFHKAQSSDSSVQMMVYNQLKSFNDIPDFNNYLIYIFANLVQENEYIRNQAGLYLKSNIINSNLTMSDDIIMYAKKAAIQTLVDKNKMIRATSGTLISTILQIYKIDTWPEILPNLVELLDHPEIYVVEASINALQKICEDNTKQLESDSNQTLFYLIPKFIKLFDSPNAKVRRDAIKCVNYFVIVNSEAINANITTYIQGIYQRTSDSDPEVRKAVCQSIVSILDVFPNQLIPEIKNVVDFMLFCTQDEDESVALEACEFWLVTAENVELMNYMETFLPKIVTVLLKCMVYSEEEIEILNQSDNNPDTDQDIKPRHHKAKDAHGGVLNDKGSKEFDEDEDEEDEDEDEDEDDLSYEWNLRKCAALAIDELATMYNSVLLDILIPPLQEKLMSTDWKDVECAILAIGAIAEGCGDKMEPYLPEMMKFLLNNLNNPVPLVRSITCWTLSRYSNWVVTSYQELDAQGNGQSYFLPLLEGILNTLLDNSKKVQEACCSALVTFTEAAQGELIPYMSPIIEKLAMAYDRYQNKNLLILYNAIGTVAEAFGEAINNQQFVELILKPLLKRWSVLKDDDRDLFPIFECLTYVAIGMGPGFLQYAPQLWERCMSLIETTVSMAEASAIGAIDDDVDKDFIVVSLDLLSGIIEGVGAQSTEIISSTHDRFMSILFYCLKDTYPDVQQSAYALLGELAINAFQFVKPNLNEIFNGIMEQIVPNEDEMYIRYHSSVYNNAIWASGEIALKNGADTATYVNPLLERYIPLLQNESTPSNIKENIAITLGRLGYVCTALVAPHVEHFIKQWSNALRSTSDNDEKISAFMGMCLIIEANPNGVSKDFVYFVDAITQFNDISPELNEKFKNILYAFKPMYGDQWESMLSSLPDINVQQIMRQRLTQRYQI